jgi:very-short-patch-repair endonuclease
LDFEREFRFCPERRWRADYRLKAVMLHGMQILIEIDGAVYSMGRHTRGAGREADMRKINKAQALGYMVLSFSTTMVLRGETRSFLQEHLGL